MILIKLLQAAFGFPARAGAAISARFNARLLSFWILGPIEVALLVGFSWLSYQAYAVVAALTANTTLDLAHDVPVATALGWTAAILCACILSALFAVDAIVFGTVWLAGLFWRIPGIRLQLTLLVLRANARIDAKLGGQRV